MCTGWLHNFWFDGVVYLRSSRWLFWYYFEKWSNWSFWFTSNNLVMHVIPKGKGAQCMTCFILVYFFSDIFSVECLLIYKTKSVSTSLANKKKQSNIIENWTPKETLAYKIYDNSVWCVKICLTVQTVFLLPEALDIAPAFHDSCSGFLPSKNELLLLWYQPLTYANLFSFLVNWISQQNIFFSI